MGILGLRQGDDDLEYMMMAVRKIRMIVVISKKSKGGGSEAGQAR